MTCWPARHALLRFGRPSYGWRHKATNKAKWKKTTNTAAGLKEPGCRRSQRSTSRSESVKTRLNYCYGTTLPFSKSPSRSSADTSLPTPTSAVPSPFGGLFTVCGKCCDRYSFVTRRQPKVRYTGLFRLAMRSRLLWHGCRKSLACCTAQHNGYGYKINKV